MEVICKFYVYTIAFSFSTIVSKLVYHTIVVMIYFQSRIYFSNVIIYDNISPWFQQIKTSIWSWDQTDPWHIFKNHVFKHIYKDFFLIGLCYCWRDKNKCLFCLLFGGNLLFVFPHFYLKCSIVMAEDLVFDHIKKVCRVTCDNAGICV